MGTVVSYFEHKRRAAKGRVRHTPPVICEILEALHALGDSAHRQAVADQIVQRRNGRAGPSESAARDEIYAAFDAYLAQPASRRAPVLLCRPLGSASYRWSLTDSGMQLFQPTAMAARGGR